MVFKGCFSFGVWELSAANCAMEWYRVKDLIFFRKTQMFLQKWMLRFSSKSATHNHWEIYGSIHASCLTLMLETWTIHASIISTCWSIICSLCWALLCLSCVKQWDVLSCGSTKTWQLFPIWSQKIVLSVIQCFESHRFWKCKQETFNL